MAVSDSCHRRRCLGLARRAGLCLGGPHYGSDGQRLRGLQGQREQEADGNTGAEGPDGWCGKSVCDYYDQLLHFLRDHHGHHRGKEVRSLYEIGIDQQRGVVESDLLWPLVLCIQRASNLYHQEDKCGNVVSGKHCEARYRHRWSCTCDAREPLTPEAYRLQYWHWRCVPVLCYRRLAQEVSCELVSMHATIRRRLCDPGVWNVLERSARAGSGSPVKCGQ
mmetsp:Transcript_12635/g.17822  ORF Transcript_12635/g.17822 Transcript_12635/m.17822 type:complete len:221 (-) Transcript_12635:26-688(-)